MIAPAHKPRLRLGASRSLWVMMTIGCSLTMISSASGANVVPNGDFEAACGSATKACSWPEQANSCCENQRDPSIGHGGSSASYRLKVVSNGQGVLTQGDCITPNPAVEGSAVVSFWYRTVDARVTDVRLVPFFHSSAACNVSAIGPLVRTTSPIADGEWHEVTRSVAITAEQASRPALWFDVGFLCAAACSGAEIHVDDIVFDQEPPTRAKGGMIRAEETNAGVRLRWTTHSERDTLGFNVYANQRGKLTKINRALIPSLGRPQGHVYSFLDGGAFVRSTPLAYALQAVHVDGRRTWLGSVNVP